MHRRLLTGHGGWLHTPNPLGDLVLTYQDPVGRDGDDGRLTDGQGRTDEVLVDDAADTLTVKRA